MQKVIGEIAQERQRQINDEGWTEDHDDSHDIEELAVAAACYAYPKIADYSWPWSYESYKPTNRRRDLIKAAAMIVAEIERIDRLESVASQTQSGDAGKGTNDEL